MLASGVLRERVRELGPSEVDDAFVAEAPVLRTGQLQ